jgi:hypothetical protein
MVDAQDYETGVHIVRHVLSRRWQRMNSREVACVTKVRAQALFEFLHDRVGIALVLFRAVISKFRHRGLS